MDLFPAAVGVLGAAHREVEALELVLRASETGTGSPTGGRSVEDDALTELDQSYDAAERVGFVIGCLGAACGANLLGARRVSDGMARMAEALVAALEERGFVLDPSPACLPALVPTVGEGWELPLLVTSLLLRAGNGGEVVRWSVEEGEQESALRISPLADELDDHGECVRAFGQTGLAGLRLECVPSGAKLLFPSAWLVSS